MPAIKRGDLTISDMLVLRVLAERPMHGHQVSLELARHELRAWIGISRPQVYWSLNKLEKMELICAVEPGDVQPPRQRRVFVTTSKSREAFTKALRYRYWTNQLPRALFLAWMILAHEATPDLLRRQVRRRKKFLGQELARERAILKTARNAESESRGRISWAVGLTIEQIELELNWLGKLSTTKPIARVRRIRTSAEKESHRSKKLASRGEYKTPSRKDRGYS